MDLKELLVSLHEGNEVVLERRENQYGAKVAVDTIFIEDGIWKGD